MADEGKPPIAALFVQVGGCYYGQDGVDPWDQERDARTYTGMSPVVAHPPCKRWGRFWHGSTRKPHQFRLGEDQGTFGCAMTSVRNYGGVLEHPAHSRAFKWFGLPIPGEGQGWSAPDAWGGRSCYVEQGQYGHESNKPTWLYACRIDFAELNWTSGGQRLPQWMIDRYGYEKARRIGQVAMVGGKDKERIRDATPPEFRDILVALARSVYAEGLL